MSRRPACPPPLPFGATPPPPPFEDGHSTSCFESKMRDDIAREILPTIVKAFADAEIQFTSMEAGGEAMAKRAYVIADSMVKVRKTYR